MKPLRVLIALLAALAWAPAVPAQEPPTPPPIRIHFVDVGQGDGVLVQTPTGNVVYDAGEHPERMREYLAAIGISSVGVVIASHNHADHIGGLPSLIRAFRPVYYMDNGIPASTQVYARVLEAVAAAGTQLIQPTARKVVMGNASLTIVPPPGIPDWDQNDNSIGVVIEYGEFRLSLTGDSEPREWAWWRVHQPEWLQRPVHVHKASHHGSSNGDTIEGITALSPEVVVVGRGCWEIRTAILIRPRCGCTPRLAREYSAPISTALSSLRRSSLGLTQSTSSEEKALNLLPDRCRRPCRHRSQRLLPLPHLSRRHRHPRQPHRLRRRKRRASTSTELACLSCRESSTSVRYARRK